MAKYQYTELDLSPLLVPNVKFAVRCETENEAREFIAQVIEQFPSKKTSLHPDNPRFDDDNDGRHGGRAYFPDLNDAEGDCFMIGDVEYANNHGFILIYFRDLPIQTQIDESDVPLDLLFGTVKT